MKSKLITANFASSKKFTLADYGITVSSADDYFVIINYMTRGIYPTGDTAVNVTAYLQDKTNTSFTVASGTGTATDYSMQIVYS